MDWTRMYIEMGLTTDLLLSNYIYNPFETKLRIIYKRSLKLCWNY